MICVLVAAAGAAWESTALRLLDETSGVVVLRRCVDVDDLLAAATTGQADVAVLALDAPGLDAAAVEHLRRQRVRPIAVVADASPAAADPAELRAARIGVPVVVGETELDRLPRLVDTPPEEPSTPDEAPARPVPEPSAPSTQGRVIAVWGPHGGAGRTTVATAAAAELARRGLPTLLVDADPWGGAVAQQLGILDEVSGILAAARLAVAGELASRLESVPRAVDDRLSVVTGLPRPDRYVEVRAGALEHLLELGRARGQVVVDTGFSLEDDPASEFGARPGRNAMTLAALSTADEVVVVGGADPVGLSRLARGLIELRDLTAGAPVRVVVNRMRSSLGWSERDIAGMVEGFTRAAGVHFLPEDRAAVDRALVAGRLLTEVGDSALARGVGELVDTLVPSSRTAVTGRRLGRRRPRRLPA